MVSDLKKLKKLKKLSPLTETTFYILISLLEPLHGYGIMQKVLKLSKGRLNLGPGTLYGALGNMVSMGLINPEESGESESRRKVYRITGLGIELINYEIDRLGEMIGNGRALINKQKTRGENTDE